MTNDSRQLKPEEVEGEIGLVIDYLPGQARALDVLGGAMALIGSLDRLDAALLSSINTELEPVSILNDVQHSSLKILLSRFLKAQPDEHLYNLDVKKWIGSLLVKGKYLLLQNLDADAPVIDAKLKSLRDDYQAAPGLAGGYELPKVKEVQSALREVAKARQTLGDQPVIIQTELGDVTLGPANGTALPVDPTVVQVRTNYGRELLKIRYPDMLGQAQWTVLRAGRTARVELLHKAWLDAYHAREFIILPGDSLDCSFEESVGYDAQNNEVERKLSILEVHQVVTPPTQLRLPDVRG